MFASSRLSRASDPANKDPCDPVIGKGWTFLDGSDDPALGSHCQGSIDDPLADPVVELARNGAGTAELKRQRVVPLTFQVVWLASWTWRPGGDR